jgi:hypothetical protein
MFRLNYRRTLTILNFFATKMSLIIVAISQSWGQEVEFFESHIRPAFHAHCLSCHHQGKKSGGLALDSREGWQAGGDSGPALQVGAPDSSLLIRVMEHLEPGLEMPAKSPKLSSATIEVFRKWILQGAHDPRDKPEELDPSQVNVWESLYRERATWWAFTPPKTDPHSWDSTTAAIDRWIRDRLDGAGVSASPTADPGTLLRRLNLVLCGLPPDSDFLDRYRELLGDELRAQVAWTQAIDTLLDTPEFAEHWARHWMDIVRYAETHGSEDDAYLPFAYRYRDYLVRAFAQDISVQRLIQEHLAGDLIEPRRNPEQNFNESLIGLCFYRLVEFNQTPIDVKREEIAVIDSQIDTIGKAFQALTISCARCHDHKFDPISDEDYYSLYGILRSTRTAMRAVDSPELFTAKSSRKFKMKLAIDGYVTGSSICLSGRTKLRKLACGFKSESINGKSSWARNGRMSRSSSVLSPLGASHWLDGRSIQRVRSWADGLRFSPTSVALSQSSLRNSLWNIEAINSIGNDFPRMQRFCSIYKTDPSRLGGSTVLECPIKPSGCQKPMQGNLHVGRFMARASTP